MQLNLIEPVERGSITRSCNDQGLVLVTNIEPATNASPGGQITFVLAENQELKGQIEQLRSERTRWLETQRRMMDLLHTASPDKLVHDLRNLLNERDLLKTLVDAMG
jgi:hypothetical protein